MEVKFLDGKCVAGEIERLMDEYDEFYWAVAWGSRMRLAEKLLCHKDKVKKVTFGLAFGQTDPKLIDKFIDDDRFRVVKRLPNGVFHPKLYVFRRGKDVAALIGSANFTRGGLYKNEEASVLITGSIKEKALDGAFGYVNDCFLKGQCVTKYLAEWYHRSYRKATKIPERPRDLLFDMDWREYIQRISKSGGDDIEERLVLLETVRIWLSKVSSFADLGPLYRKAIAGAIGSKERKTDIDPDLDQGWELFGAMSAPGGFTNLVGDNNKYLAAAIDSIPLTKKVERKDFCNFCDNFQKAFEKSDRKGRIAPASRLLAMKRPDVFFCITGQNKVNAAKQMSLGKRDIGFTEYWDRVVEVIRLSDWYNVRKPQSSKGRRIWECRAAMLDAVLYVPTEGQQKRHDKRRTNRKRNKLNQ